LTFGALHVPVVGVVTGDTAGVSGFGTHPFTGSNTRLLFSQASQPPDPSSANGWMHLQIPDPGYVSTFGASHGGATHPFKGSKTKLRFSQALHPPDPSSINGLAHIQLPEPGGSSTLGGEQLEPFGTHPFTGSKI